MITSGITITLNRAPGASPGVLDALRSCSWLELGPSGDVRIAAVLEAPTPALARARFEALQQVPGVALVQLVVAHFTYDEPDDPPCEPAAGGRVTPNSQNRPSMPKEQP